MTTFAPTGSMLRGLLLRQRSTTAMSLSRRHCLVRRNNAMSRRLSSAAWTAVDGHCHCTTPATTYHNNTTYRRPLWSSAAPLIDDEDEDEDENYYEHDDDRHRHTKTQRKATKHCTTCTCRHPPSLLTHFQNPLLIHPRPQPSSQSDEPAEPPPPPPSPGRRIKPQQETDQAKDSNNNDRQEPPLPDNIQKEEDYPPPLPEPKVTFRRRVLPTQLRALSGPDGQQALMRAFTQQTAATYFMLTQHWDNQSDPASCGVTTLRQVLNAAGMDPTAVRWKGGWRYYGSDAMVICQCLDPIRIQRAGITMTDFDRLAHCHGLQGQWERPDGVRTTTTTTEIDAKSPPKNDSSWPATSTLHHNTVDDFRRDILTSLQSTGTVPSTTDDDTSHQSITPPTFLVVSFSRAVLQQTGDGHFSTVAAYDAETDSCLVLDVARFKYPPYWVGVSELYEAMRPTDSVTQESRGWSLWERAGPWPTYLNPMDGNVYDDGALPATWVPAFDQTNDSACPLRPIQVQYCSTAWERRNPQQAENAKKG